MNTVSPSAQPVSFSLRSPVALKVSQHVADVGILVAAFALAYQLRFDFAVPPVEVSNLLKQLPYVIAVQLLALRWSGVQAFIWRYISFIELQSFVRAAVFASAPLFAMRVLLPESMGALRVPLSVTVMDTIIAFVGLIGIRATRRTIYERRDKQRTSITTNSESRKRILLIGAGRAGQASARDILNRGDSEFTIVGFVDDDEGKRGTVIQGIRVLGATSDLPRLVADLKIDHALISIAEASRNQLKRIIAICDAVPVKVRIIPALGEILEGRVSVSRVRDIQVEDLIGRAPVQLDVKAVGDLIAGRTVLVTGAGGSIGSELARQAGRFKPACLLLVERAEGALFNVDRQVRELYPECRVEALVADIGDHLRMDQILGAYRPHVILHAAAHKHVPLMEINPSEAIKNNALATNTLAQLAGEWNTDAFVLISTDKAVRPRSMMGASKRLAELAVQNLGGRFSTRYVIVRFGNVIGSAGSVVPIFREQIRNGGPVTVTHPDMTRYFMTIPEASQLVLQAAVIGGSGQILILDMGEPVRILDLARDTIRLSGLKPDEDIAIVFTGIRPGEKLFEELQTTGEGIERTRHPQIFVGNVAGLPRNRMPEVLRTLEVLARDGGGDEIRRYLNELLPEASLELKPQPEADREQRPMVPVLVRATGAVAEN
jgi:FlaA1/EpsC-like NDP-sugar epimerase